MHGCIMYTIRVSTVIRGSVICMQGQMRFTIVYVKRTWVSSRNEYQCIRIYDYANGDIVFVVTVLKQRSKFDNISKTWHKEGMKILEPHVIQFEEWTGLECFLHVQHEFNPMIVRIQWKLNGCTLELSWYVGLLDTHSICLRRTITFRFPPMFSSKSRDREYKQLGLSQFFHEFQYKLEVYRL